MYFSQLDLKRIEGVNELDAIVNRLIRENCSKINHSISCYNWEDYPKDKNYKVLILYTPRRAYKFKLNKSLLEDLEKFNRKIVQFIRKTRVI